MKLQRKLMGKILNDLSEQLEADNSEMSVKQEISEQVSLKIPLDGNLELKEDSAITQQKEHGNSEYGLIKMPPKLVKRGRS